MQAKCRMKQALSYRPTTQVRNGTGGLDGFLGESTPRKQAERSQGRAFDRDDSARPGAFRVEGGERFVDQILSETVLREPPADCLVPVATRPEPLGPRGCQAHVVDQTRSPERVDRPAPLRRSHPAPFQLGVKELGAQCTVTQQSSRCRHRLHAPELAAQAA